MLDATGDAASNKKLDLLGESISGKRSRLRLTRWCSALVTGETGRTIMIDAGSGQIMPRI